MTLAFDADDGPGIRATLGVVVLRTDETIEGDLRAFLPSDGVAVYHTRIPFEPTVTAETLSRMSDDLTRSVSLLPDAASFDAIGYGCTSASAVIGEAGIAEKVNAVFPRAEVTNPLTATKAALAALGARRIALVTPYIADVSETLRNRLAEAGVETVTFASFEQIEDAIVARITPASLLRAIVETGRAAPVDAVFASCTSLRSAGIIVEAERQLGIPVISSNQALAWHMMRLAGLTDAPAALGRLGQV